MNVKIVGKKKFLIVKKKIIYIRLHYTRPLVNSLNLVELKVANMLTAAS